MYIWRRIAGTLIEVILVSGIVIKIILVTMTGIKVVEKAISRTDTTPDTVRERNTNN